MSFSVTSWFVDQATLRSSTPKRVFTIAGSDYSSRVLKWPTIKREWNAIRPTNLTIGLTNEDGALNFFRTDKTKLRVQCQVRIGFTHPTSGDELITQHQGYIEQIRYSDGSAELSIVDNMKEFAERVLGSDDTPLSYTGSNYLPSDIMWWLCTSYGGKSAVASTSNPDIDYTSFAALAQVFSNDSLFIQAQFKGTKLNEALRKLGRMTDAGIYDEGGKITFARFTESNSVESMIGSTEARSIELRIDDTLIVNKQWVYANYNTTSGQWAINCFVVETPSVNSFGLREAIEKDESVWYVSSATAQNLAQRRTLFTLEPPELYTIDTTLVVLHRQIGDMVRLTDPLLSVTSADSWRIMSYAKDLDTGKSRVIVSNERIAQPFILDHDVYGLLDQNYNFLL